MKRILFSALAFALCAAQANAAAGFGCEADDQNVVKCAVE